MLVSVTMIRGVDRMYYSMTRTNIHFFKRYISNTPRFWGSWPLYEELTAQPDAFWVPVDLGRMIGQEEIG